VRQILHTFSEDSLDNADVNPNLDFLPIIRKKLPHINSCDVEYKCKFTSPSGFLEYVCNRESYDISYLWRDLVRGGAPGAAAPDVFEDLLNEEFQF